MTTNTDNTDKELAEIILQTGLQTAERIGAKAIIFSYEGIGGINSLKKFLPTKHNLIVFSSQKNNSALLEGSSVKFLLTPPVTLSRLGQIKTTVMLSFSKRYLDVGDKVIFLVGPFGGMLDTMVIISVGEEWEIFHTKNQPRLTEHIKRVVFHQGLLIALELAAEGREGKPVGGLFVIGDHRNVLHHCEQNIFNPFKGYSENSRNILDETMRETIKNFAKLDGAFVVKGNGVIVSAGTHLKTVKPTHAIPQGLGARHAAAAGITSITRSIALTLSESTGTVRIWRRGTIITEIERPAFSGEDYSILTRDNITG
jgi:DNA integrity scanning protein DisA with diadenylate cyclase activity